MATITASMFMALDGVVDPGVGNWHFPYFNEEMGEAVDNTHDADVMLFGRVTYDSFAGAWPDRAAAGEEDAAMAKRSATCASSSRHKSPACSACLLGGVPAGSSDLSEAGLMMKRKAL